MKNLIATMAVLFTMATAASADHNVRLKTCLVGAVVSAIADQKGLPLSQVQAWLITPSGDAIQHKIAAKAEMIAQAMVQIKTTGGTIKDVQNATRTGKVILDHNITKCVIDLFSEPA
tara:strand:+ start:2571 stop:2921 length:351 start_codon:yes stop_codon:yes gene_type:complete